MTDSIKILLVLPFYYPHRGGSQKYAEELYVKLCARHTDVQVDVLCYNTDKAVPYEEYRGTRIYRVDCFNIIPARFAIPNPFKLHKQLKLLSQNKYDFVNTHIRFFDPTWWLWLYGRRIGAKSIFTGHVATHPVYQKKLVEIVARFVDLTIAAWSLKKYDFVTFTNKTAQKFFNEKLGYKKESFVVYGGIDTSFFKPHPRFDRYLPKLKKSIPNDHVLVTFVGRMIWTKGVTYLYEAAVEILKKHDKVIFILAGPGELEQSLTERIKEAGLEDKIIMTGNLSYEEVRDLLAISDIFVNPSHHNEGFPNTVLEGGSCECYVIATDNAGTWEVVKTGETGELIPQKSTKDLIRALDWAVENPQKRTEIAKKFRELLVKQFDWDVIAEQYYNLLKSWNS